MYFTSLLLICLNAPYSLFDGKMLPTLLYIGLVVDNNNGNDNEFM